KKRILVKSIPAPLKFVFDKETQPQHIALGYGFTLVCANKSKKQYLKGFGINSSSQVGPQTSKSDIDFLIKPTNIHLPESLPIIGLAAGKAHSIVACKDRLFTFGNNCYGQCGRAVIEGEIYKHSNVVHSVPVESGVRGVTCGCDHSVLVTEKGDLFSCGWGADGQTGHGHYENTHVFSPVLGDTEGVDIIKVVSAGDTNLALSRDGEIFGWGNSEYDQLRIPSMEPQINVSRHIPLKIGKVVDIACNCTACIALNKSGEVFVWGYGILGLGGMVSSVKEPTELPRTLFGKPSSNVTAVFGGSSAFAVVNNLGNAYIWGKNKNGSLGLGNSKENQYFPFRLPISGKVLNVVFGFEHTSAIVKQNI
ncbi:RCC1-like G exchanging factor-like protein, partial [Octopus sinensis]|uniref:RCC1-like G exchanging factor-like protein n=1 Tax=Octopus sinensis TaxID=2607531 RepID=A0A7E6ELP0_9MOLL